MTGIPYNFWTTGEVAGTVDCVAGGYGGSVVTLNLYCNSAVPGSLYLELVCDGAARATYARLLSDGLDCFGCVTLTKTSEDACCVFPETIELCATLPYCIKYYTNDIGSSNSLDSPEPDPGPHVNWSNGEGMNMYSPGAFPPYTGWVVEIGGESAVWENPDWNGDGCATFTKTFGDGPDTITVCSRCICSSYSVITISNGFTVMGEVTFGGLWEDVSGAFLFSPYLTGTDWEFFADGGGPFLPVTPGWNGKGSMDFTDGIDTYTVTGCD